jgi:hypothetical protein
MSAIPAFVDLAAVADILAELGNEVEQLGVSLCMDPAVAGHHVKALQAFDLIAQKQRGLASLLRADCPVTALAELGLEELKERLGSPFDRR